jgi:hypothetical protein
MIEMSGMLSRPLKIMDLSLAFIAAAKAWHPGSISNSADATVGFTLAEPGNTVNPASHGFTWPVV